MRYRNKATQNAISHQEKYSKNAIRYRSKDRKQTQESIKELQNSYIQRSKAILNGISQGENPHRLTSVIQEMPHTILERKVAQGTNYIAERLHNTLSVRE